MIASKGTKTLARDTSCPPPGLAWLRGRMGDRERNSGLSSTRLWAGGGVEPPRSSEVDVVEVTARLEDSVAGASRSSLLTCRLPKSIPLGVLCG